MMGRPGGAGDVGGVGGLRITHSQRYSRDLFESERKCIREATQATQRRRRVMGRSGGAGRHTLRDRAERAPGE